MTSYTLQLTPTHIHPGSEGYMDSSVVGGVSAQRTGFIEVFNSDDRKIVKIVDGATFTDTMQVITDNDFIV